MIELSSSDRWPENGNGLIFDCNYKREFAVTIFWFEYFIGDDCRKVEFYTEHHKQEVQERGQRALHCLADRCGVNLSTIEGPWEFLEKEVDEACIGRIAEIVREPPVAKVRRRTAPGASNDRARRHQSVYVIACSDSDIPLCKIGIATSPDSRLQQLSTSSPHRLQLVGHLSVPNARDIEAKAHARFADSRRNGEWFSIAPDDALEFITLAARGRA